MRISTAISVLLVVAVALAVTMLLLRGPRLSARESKLIKAFPALSLPRTHHSAGFIHDPLVRPVSNDPGEKGYDEALTVLLTRQNELRDQEQRFREVSARLAHPLDIGGKQAESAKDAKEVLKQHKAAHELAMRDVAEAGAALSQARTAQIAAEKAIETARPGLNGNQGGGDGLLVERNTILVMFRDDADVKAIKDVLERHHLVVKSGMASITMFVTKTLDVEQSPTPEGEATRLRSIVAALRKESIVETAIQNTLLSATIIPKANDSAHPHPWFDKVHVEPLVTSKFPYAWNFNDAIKDRPPIDVGILDVGFLTDLKPADVKVTMVQDPKETKEPPPDQHGTLVAGIIGASFGNGHGVDGAAPYVQLHGCAPVPKTFDATGMDFEASEVEGKHVAFDGFVEGLETLLNVPVRVVNASIGYNWSVRKITPSDVTKPFALAAQEIVKNHGQMVRKILRAHADAVVVSSAGNDDGAPAVWANPFNWAALGESSKADPPSDNVIVVEALDQTGTKLIPESNTGGTIQAVGMNLLSIVNVVKVAPNTYADVVAFCREGTSLAAPLVTAAIAQMLAINPALRPADIKTNLGISDTNKPQLNAFEAVKASSPNFGADIANYDGKNGVDMDDFRRFKDDYKTFTAGVASGTFDRDLNGDGVVDGNEGLAPRSDFNADGVIDEKDLAIMIGAWNDRSVDPNTLPAELKKP